jgi:hypothetical protein
MVVSASVVDAAGVRTGPGIPAATLDRLNYVVEIDNPRLHPHEVEIEIRIEGGLVEGKSALSEILKIGPNSKTRREFVVLRRASCQPATIQCQFRFLQSAALGWSPWHAVDATTL